MLQNTRFLWIVLSLALIVIIILGGLLVLNQQPQQVIIRVTASPIPTSVPPTSTPPPPAALGAIPADELHKNLPSFTVLNPDTYDFHSGATFETIGDVYTGQERRLAIPDGWEYVGDWRTPPFINLCDDKACVDMEISWLQGEWGLALENIRLQPDTTYIVKVAYTPDLSPAEGATWFIGDVGFSGKIYVTDGTVTDLPRLSVEEPQGDRTEKTWIIRTDKVVPTIRLEVYAYSRWATVEGSLIWNEVSIQTAPSDEYGEDRLIEF
jgi:hypothetical protein